MDSVATAEEILVFLLGMSVLVYAALFWERKAKIQPVPNPEPLIFPWKEKILRELAVIEGPLHSESPKEAMTRFASLVDIYIHESFSLDPAPLTTPEIVAVLALKGIGDRLEAVRFLLSESDWVKFSTENNQEEHWQTLFRTFRGILE